MQVLEYQNECSQIRYPFRDTATLIWSSGGNSGVLPNNVIVDAQLIALDGIFSSLSLTTIVYSSISWIFNFTGSASLSITIPIPSPACISTFNTSTSTKVLYVDINVTALTTYFTGLSYGTYTFDSSCSICLSCVKLLPPNITRIALINTTSLGITTIYDTGAILVPGTGLALSEGTNLGFTTTPNTCTFDVNQGLGQGQYDNCPASSAILTINEVEADSTGNFVLTNDGCYSSYAGISGLHLQNICNPECTAANIINFADYYNRVTDLTTQMAGYANTTNTNYNTWLTNYTITQNAQLQPSTPYILAQANSITNIVNQYHTIVVGVYYSTNSAITTSLSLSLNTSEFTIVSGTYYLVEDNTKKVQPTPVFSSSTAPLFNTSFNCATTTLAGLTLQEAAVSGMSHLNQGTALYDATFLLTTSSVGISGFVLPLNPSNFNFTLAYVVQYIYSVPGNILSPIAYQVVSFDLGFLDPTNTTGNLSLAVSGIVGTVTLNQTIFDGVTASHSGSGFTSLSINPVNSNHYYLTLTCAATLSGTYPITFTTSGVGSASKTVNIVLI